MHILEKIVAHKKKELLVLKESASISALEGSKYFNEAVPSLKSSIKSKTEGGIIAEFKKKSPSKHNINLTANVTGIVSGYERAGVASVSVLTDSFFFGGKSADLIEAKETVSLPLLRKDFIIDSYQIVEAKAIGASVILLIARILSAQEMKSFTSMAHNLGLEVLIEIHNQEELDNCPDNMDIIGVNNRNLDTFTVDYENSIRLASQLPKSLCRISESGITDTDTMVMLREAGFDGFLIGERFMKNPNPGQACHEFLEDYKAKIKVRS